MEEGGSQVVTPIVSFQNMVGRFCISNPISKKRNLQYHPPNASHHHASDAWNSNNWDWDSAKFVAKPSQCGEDTVKSNQGLSARNESQNPTTEDVESLSLKLGDGDRDGDGAVRSGTSGETDSGELHNNVSRPVKKVRPGSPGGSNYLMCQVDACNENLSMAKDYHKRHKVCEVHSKASEATVGKQTQRFCQQCSRFHPLPEFDEGKRSCRRRLAGHNRRRRKIHSEENTQQLLLPQSCDQNLGNSEIINLLVALSHAQRNNQGMNTPPDKSRLIRFISNVKSSLPGGLASQLKGSVPTSHVLTGTPVIQKIAAPLSTKDLLGALTSNPRTASSDILEMQSSQTSTQGSDSAKSKSSSVDETNFLNLHSGQMKEFPRSRPAYNNKTPPNVPPFQLFGLSSEDFHSKKSQTCLNFRSPCSNNSEGGLSLPSNPVARDFFAMQSSREKMRDDDFPNDQGEISTSLRLFGGSSQRGENTSFRSSPDQIEQASTSGSNYSPSSLNSDCLDRTGRIIFKLFDKDPSHLPVSLRMQIHNWLSNSPSDMESYIRPGCIVLSLYISMPAIAWDLFEENFLNYVRSLVADIDVHFWGTGRFLVQTNRQMASFNEGKFRLCKSWRNQTTPELVSISPLAVVRGQETSLLLKGRRLLTPGTKIHCTHAVGYCIRKRSASCEDSTLDEIIMDSFKIDGSSSSDFSRCYIEIENGLKGASFPLIVADKAICDELRLLERDIDSKVEVLDDSSSREWALHFLNELGWLLQRKYNRFPSAAPDYSLTRLKFLLVFSVDHDFCVVVKVLLDILLEFNLCTEGLESESLEMLSEIHLLNRAVTRRCRSMVTMLIHYSIVDPTNDTRRYIFAPNLAGPGGLTPLHLVACLSQADDLVDALTSDPLEMGLTSWDSVLDANGISPNAYATMGNNHSYNSLIARKIADRRNGQVLILISNETPLSEMENVLSNPNQPRKSCSRCVAVAASHGYSRNHPGFRTLFRLPYIHPLLLVAAVCVCVCVVVRGHPSFHEKSQFSWENLDYGAS